LIGQNSRKALFLHFFLLILLTGFLVFPKFTFAGFDAEDVKNSSQIKLSDSDSAKITQTLIQKLSNKWVEISCSANFSLEEQAAITAVRNGAKIKASHYMMIDLPQEMGKQAVIATIKIAKILITEDPTDLIVEIEKMSVEKAKEYAMNWLNQNEIKINSGNMLLSYLDYSGNWENFSLPYIIAFKKLSIDQAYISIGFYSSEYIEAPFPKAGMQWEGGVESIPPFILRVKGVVKEQNSSFAWIGNPYIKASFDEPVPKFDFPEPTFWQKIKDYLKSLVPDLNFLRANVGDELRDFANFNQNQDFIFIDESAGLNQKSDNKTIEEENLETENPNKNQNIIEEHKDKPLTLEEIQDLLDNISEQIDQLAEEVNILTNNQPESLADEDSDKESDKNKEQKIQEAPKNYTYVQGGGTTAINVGPSYCIKSLSSNSAQDKIIINEISWAGSNASSNNEWVELKNITENPVNLSGWQVLDKENQIKIFFSNQDIIPAQGFYLLERTDDESVPNISADYIYTGALGDTNENLYLFNGNCELEDEAIADPNWQAGEKESKKTMERASADLTWHTYAGQENNGIMGTPKAENSVSDNSITINDAKNLIISEIQASEAEFIELYNPTNNAIDLSEYYFSYYSSQREWNNPFRNKKFNPESEIKAKGYYLIGLNKYPERYGNPGADWQPYDNSELSNSSGAIAIFPFDPETKTIEEAEAGKIDAIGWGGAKVKESESVLQIEDNKSVARKISAISQNYQDSDNNKNDFETKEPSPTNSNEETIYIHSFINSPWPMYKQNYSRTGQSLFQGPIGQPSIMWVYPADNNQDVSVYSYPIIDDNGIIYLSANFTDNKKGVLGLNSDASVKILEQGEPPLILLGKENEILADSNNYNAIAPDKSYYYGSNNTLSAFNQDSTPKWQRKFEFENPTGECSLADPFVGPPVVSMDGTIYAVVQKMTCNANLDYSDYLFAIDPANNILWQYDLGGYNTAEISVSNNGDVYLFNMFFGKYAIGPSGYLKSFTNNGLKWSAELWKESSPHFYSFPIIDSQSNSYIIVDKTLFGFDKDGNKIWELSLDSAPSDWHISNLSVILSADGTLYLTGRGAIVAVK